MSEQTPFGSPSTLETAIGIADNPEPRCLCMLLLDVSGSMRGAPIRELNDGLTTFKNELMADELAAKRVEVGIVTFGPVTVVNEFQLAKDFYPPTLSSSGDTPMGAAILKGLELLRERKDTYRQHGLGLFRPWVFLITDGAPTDAWDAAAGQVREGEASKSLAFFAIGVEGANMEILAQIAVRAPVKLRGLDFRSLFQWLSSSMKSVSRSTPGTEVPLPPPSGWASV